jgi:hypothetical protein
MAIFHAVASAAEPPVRVTAQLYAEKQCFCSRATAHQLNPALNP